VKAARRKFSIGPGRGNGLGLALLLSLVVLVPSICLLWFMTQAVRNERLAVRQKLGDAYRAHLTLVQERLESNWKKIAHDLEADSEKVSALALFAREVKAGRADALICFDANGRQLYPSPSPTPKSEPLRDARWRVAQGLELNDPLAAARLYEQLSVAETNLDFAAQAMQAHARCLLRADQKEQAISVLTNLVTQARFEYATDPQGRLLVPNTGLMLLELAENKTNGIFGPILTRLRQALDDYDNPAMSSPQRRFLMRELQRLFPGQIEFPTLAAEDLAAGYVDAESDVPVVPGLRLTRLAGVWKSASPRGRIVSLHKTEALVRRMRASAGSEMLPADVRLGIFSPGQEAEGVWSSQPAGTEFPGWRLGLSLNDQQIFQTASQQRVSSYVWIGVLVILTVLVLGSLALGLIRRQVTLTQLRNDLVANVTHELKTPLSSMRLLVETLLDSKTLNEKTTREYLELIARENSRLSRLIDNFLTFSRMERNKYAFSFKEVRPQAIVDAASAALHERLGSPGCQFTVQVTPDLPLVSADPDAMVTVLLNLLDNAFKYSGEQKRISLSAASENGHVIFSVKDNGVGLAARETKRIFKRFYQVDQHMSRTAGGCGLGLSIVQYVVTAHHGKVFVQSQPGQGSEFTVSIPVWGARPKDEPINGGGN